VQDGMRPACTFPSASFDSVVLAAVVAELQDLVGGRVQRVLGAGPGAVVLAVRCGGRTRLLLACARPRWARLVEVPAPPPGEADAFAGLVRSRLVGAVVRGLTAAPFERLATLAVDTLDGPAHLYAELTGRHPNLVLACNGVVVGLLRPVAGPGREVRPQRAYVPPIQTRPTPATLTAAALAAVAGQRPEAPAWRTLLDAVAGIGPALAHELCLRADVRPDAPLDPARADAVVAAAAMLAADVAAQRFAPVLYCHATTPVAYAPFPFRVYAPLTASSTTMSAAVEAVTARAEAADRLDHARRTLAAAVAQATARAERALAALARAAHEAGTAAQLRQWGELLLAYQTHVPRGAASVQVPGFDGTPTVIPLDPARTAVENAREYFRRYAKAQAAARHVPARRAQLEAERAWLDALATAIAQAEHEDDLREIAQELQDAGLYRLPRSGRPPVGPRAGPGRAYALGAGFRALVARSAREGDRLTFQVARPDDLWLHARDVPGAHVIVQGPADPPEAVVEAAARLAAYYSRGRHAGRVPVVVTRRRYVQRVRGGRPGQVTYSNERTLVVSPGLPAGAAGPPP
jgi:predicted ribosome quality control (RQC) complex YloA/Tae2 family protein